MLGDVSIQEAVDQSELLSDSYSSHLLQKLLVNAEDKVWVHYFSILMSTPDYYYSQGG